MPLLQGGGAADPFREDLFAPRILQFLDLGIQTLLLMDGRCPSVSDFSTHLFGKVVCFQSIAPEHPFRTILGSQTPVSSVGRIRWRNPWVSEQQPPGFVSPPIPFARVRGPFVCYRVVALTVNTCRYETIAYVSAPHPIYKFL